MALAVTSLNGAITQDARQATLTAFTNPSVGAIGPRTMGIIDAEQVWFSSVVSSPTVALVRGIGGTLGVAHNTLAPVVYGLTTDFIDLAAQGSATIAVAPQATYSVDATFINPKVDQTVYITKAGVLALTLTAPTADSNVIVKFISLTANAHVITYAAGFYANTTGSDTATFPATLGGVFTMQAKNGLWLAVATADDGVLIG